MATLDKVGEKIKEKKEGDFALKAVFESLISFNSKCKFMCIECKLENSSSIWRKVSGSNASVWLVQLRLQASQAAILAN